MHDRTIFIHNGIDPAHFGPPKTADQRLAGTATSCV